MHKPKSPTQRTATRRARIAAMLDLLGIGSESTLITRMLAAIEANPVALIVAYKQFSQAINDIIKF